MGVCSGAGVQGVSSLNPTSFWRRHGRIILGIALLLVIIHDMFGAHGYMAMRRTQKQIEQLRLEVDRLNKENTDLADQVQSLRTDPKAIERIAREDMGLARPGELIFKMPASPDKSSSSDRP